FEDGQGAVEIRGRPAGCAGLDFEELPDALRQDVPAEVGRGGGVADVCAVDGAVPAEGGEVGGLSEVVGRGSGQAATEVPGGSEGETGGVRQEQAEKREQALNAAQQAADARKQTEQQASLQGMSYAMQSQSGGGGGGDEA